MYLVVSTLLDLNRDARGSELGLSGVVQTPTTPFPQRALAVLRTVTSLSQGYLSLADGRVVPG